MEQAHADDGAGERGKRVGRKRQVGRALSPQRFPLPLVRPPPEDGGPNWSVRSFCRILFPHMLRIALELFRGQTVEIDAD